MDLIWLDTNSKELQICINNFLTFTVPNELFNLYSA